MKDAAPATLRAELKDALPLDTKAPLNVGLRTLAFRLRSGVSEMFAYGNLLALVMSG